MTTAAPTVTTASRPRCAHVGWTDMDVAAVNTARVWAADAVQKAGNGHPGTAMSLAPVAYLLYQNVMRHQPSDPHWLGRDRFVLSAGHSSLTQYCQLVLGGFGLEVSDLQALRSWGSLTPGHPEVKHTPGVEITTGPLGSGVASAVGMAMATRRVRGLMDPEAEPGESCFDHRVYVIASDGDLQEGVCAEAASLAGHQQLGNLTVIYDQNFISIEDHTDIAFTEDVAQRFASYGWHVEMVDWRADSPYVEDVDALHAAIERGNAITNQPTLVIVRTIIAYPAPHLQDTGKSHGSALGADEVAATKHALGFDPSVTFPVPAGLLEHTRQLVERGNAARAAWDDRFTAWRQAHPERAALLDRLLAGALPAELESAWPTFTPADGPMATRAASGKVLTAIAEAMPELWGGSCDLADSNNTTMKGQPSFIPQQHQTSTWSGHEYGRTLHYGVRENGMGMAMNGIALNGLTRTYGGTFLVFSDYMRPAVRLAALQQLPVVYVWTHDSIGLGEDGPTHQPIEHLASLRAMPGLNVVRPADANETVVAWQEALRCTDAPTALILSRQNLPIFDRTQVADASNAARGAYVLRDGEGQPDVLLIATGSEVELALQAQDELAAAGVTARVVSMPCREWFTAQDQAYRDEVLPPSVRARVSVEAASPFGWRDLVGDAGRCVGIDHFGASAPAGVLFEEFGITVAAVVSAARESIQAAQGV